MLKQIFKMFLLVLSALAGQTLEYTRVCRNECSILTIRKEKKMQYDVIRSAPTRDKRVIT